LDIEILNLQNSDIATEIGPLKYMSTVLDKPMESIINWFILMLIFVFDPLAVLLVIFASTVYDANNKKEESEEEDKKPFLKQIREKLKKKSSEDSLEKELDETSETHKKVVDAINSDDNVIEFSYDFPEEKGDEVVEYIEDENGDFEKSQESPESLTSLISGIDSNPLYIQLLDVLFACGIKYPDGQRGVGDTIPPYKTLVSDIAIKGIVCEDKVIKNFLTICNLLDITNMSNKDDVKIVKEYSTAKGIVSLVSK
jgi:hypothetical protein